MLKFRWCLGIVLAFGAVEQAEAGSYVCPPEIRMNEAAPVGWSLRREPGWSAPQGLLRAKLQAVGIYAGDPEQLARLISDNEGDDREPRVDIWTFYPDAGPLWLSCHYRDTPVFFARELPSGIRGCRAAYDRRGNVWETVCE